jgi:hypothetical protein
MGGASRGQFFAPSGAPQTATGGASRGQFFAPSGAPQTAAGGASRLARYDINPSETYPATGLETSALIALLPQTYHGTTLAERPTFLVYLPASNAKIGLFSLKDKQGKLHYQQTVPVTGQAGIMAIQLPATAPALELGNDYQWFFALKIDGDLSPSTPYVDGWVQRIQPTAAISEALQANSPLDKANALAKLGVWYDSAALLASLRSQQPDSALMAKEWSEFLTSVELHKIQTAPIAIQ